MGIKRKPVKGVVRIEFRRTFGYQARVVWKGQRYTKFFSDGVYGGEHGAYKAAVGWVEEKEAEVGKPHSARRVWSKSWGKLGEANIWEDSRRKAFLVSVTPKPGSPPKRYYVSRKGRSRSAALLEAIKLRDALLAKIYSGKT